MAVTFYIRAVSVLHKHVANRILGAEHYVLNPTSVSPVPSPMDSVALLIMRAMIHIPMLQQMSHSGEWTPHGNSKVIQSNWLSSPALGAVWRSTSKRLAAHQRLK